MPRYVFEIYAAGRKVGISVAPNAAKARESAHYAMTRRTDSKMDVSCDYEGIVARPLGLTVAAIGAPLSV